MYSKFVKIQFKIQMYKVETDSLQTLNDLKRKHTFSRYESQARSQVHSLILRKSIKLMNNDDLNNTFDMILKLAFYIAGDNPTNMMSHSKRLDTFLCFNITKIKSQ